MKPVRVRWYDSIGMSGWNKSKDVDDFAKDRSEIMESVGFLYKKNRDCVILVQSIHAFEENTNLGEPLKIPKVSVISIDNLK